MTFSQIRLAGVKGVGTIDLTLVPQHHAYALIGANGVGKTKCLEALFQYVLLGSEWLRHGGHIFLPSESLVMREVHAVGDIDYPFVWSPAKDHQSIYIADSGEAVPLASLHRLAVVYLGSQSRGHIRHLQQPIPPIGSFEQRREAHIARIVAGMREDFSSLGMDEAIETWFVVRAQSASPFMKFADNRRIEIDSLLRLMHEIDVRIDPAFLEISGDNRVSIKIEGQTRELSQLSTGFASILKILQAIIAGYANLSNEVNLPAVRGIVLIDEIESHLHIEWQTRIVPLLKRLFPNTTFFVATHSPLILSQLVEGEAYRLYRAADRVVRSELVKRPNLAVMADLLDSAFGVDLNRLKCESLAQDDQSVAKKRLLSLLEEQEARA